MRQCLCLARFALERDQRLRMTLELDVEYFDRNVRLAVGGLQLAQIERLVDGAHAAETDAFFQHEAAVERVANTFDALEFWDTAFVDRRAGGYHWRRGRRGLGPRGGRWRGLVGSGRRCTARALAGSRDFGRRSFVATHGARSSHCEAGLR